MRYTFIFILLIICFGLNAQNKKNADMPPPPPVYPDIPPQFPGGDKAFNNFLRTNLRNPDLTKQKKDVGACRVKFMVDTDGNLKNISIVRRTDGCLECDEETKRLVSTMPKWEPALKNGKPIAAEHAIELNFSSEKRQSNSVPETEIYTVTEVMPQFPGGEAEALKFIQKNLVLPESAIKNKTFGKCFLKFTVMKDGSIKDITILKGVPDCPACDEEAKRVVSIMPNWIPGAQNGVPVSVYFTKSINFIP